MADEKLKQEVDAYVDEVWEDVVADIDRLVRIRSVEDKEAAVPGMPWGPASHEALETAIGIASRLGLDAHDCDGYIGYADLPGKTDVQVATIAHTDVVPEGLGWHFDPFTVTRKDGYLVGRGVLDDKGPFVLSLYAAHFFQRQVERTGERLPYTLRCIIGNDEETTMADVDWYLERYPQPAFCFSPDADFPLICGEKGLYGGQFTSGHVVGHRILKLDGGTVSNAVPGQATALVRATADELPAADGIDIEPAADGTFLLTAHGRGGHASMPEGTVNAIALLVDYLLDHDICSRGEMTFLGMEQQLLASTDGSSIGVDTADGKFGPLTLIGGTVRTVGDQFVQTIDCRYPTSVTGDELRAKLAAFGIQFGCSYEQWRDVTPFYVDPELPEIRTLLSTYEEYTGRPGKAFTIGGGTYARHFKRAAAFGPHDPAVQDPDWVGIEHGPDEAISEEALRRALKIYIVSIARLMKLDLG